MGPGAGLSFFAAPPDGWRIARAYVPTPWPEEVVLLDLRWWQDQVLGGREKMPGRPALMDAWGWSERNVRTLLADEERWSDPLKLEAWKGRMSSRRPAGVQRTSSHTTEEPRQSAANVQRVSSACPADVHTRGELTTTTTTTTSVNAPAPPSLALVPAEPTELEPEPPTEPDAFTLAAEYAGQVLNPAVGKGFSHGPGRGSKVGQRLWREVRKDAARVMAAMRFVVESDHNTAVYNRANGYGLETALRHLDEYAELLTFRPMPEARAGPAYQRVGPPPVEPVAPPPRRMDAQQ
jgi:hypothetical protein